MLMLTTCFTLFVLKYVAFAGSQFRLRFRSIGLCPCDEKWQHKCNLHLSLLQGPIRAGYMVSQEGGLDYLSGFFYQRFTSICECSKIEAPVEKHRQVHVSRWYIHAARYATRTYLMAVFGIHKLQSQVQSQSRLCTK